MDDECVTHPKSMYVLRNDSGDRLPELLFDYVLGVHADVTNKRAALASPTYLSIIQEKRATIITHALFNTYELCRAFYHSRLELTHESFFHHHHHQNMNMRDKYIEKGEERVKLTFCLID